MCSKGGRAFGQAVGPGDRVGQSGWAAGLGCWAQGVGLLGLAIGPGCGVGLLGSRA
jgi:hypothetical protein